MSRKKARAFEKDYFTSGNWINHGTCGKFTTYYWARKYYARVVRGYLAGGKILEIGCGFGDLLANFNNDYEVYGVEISKYACQEAVKRNPRLKVINKDALDYLKQTLENSFDAIFQICVIPHMDNPPQVINEIKRVLKKGGFFFSVVPNPNYPLNKIKGEKSAMYIDKTHKHLYKVEEWISLVENSGLKIVKKGSTGLWDVPYLPIIPKVIQLIIFGWPSALQILLGKILLPVWLGVDLLVLAKKGRQ